MRQKGKIKNQYGFTLVELMVTLVVAFLVIAAVYASFKVQQQNEKAQQQVTQIQQNLRAAMDMISREFPMAGYDPLQTGEYKIINANSNSLLFTADLCEDGDDIEKIQTTSCSSTPPSSACSIPTKEIYERYCFELYPPGGSDLRRTPNGTAVANNIDQIEFRYLLDDGTYTLNPVDLDDIVAVRVSILARADEPDYRYTDNNTYSTGFTDMDGTVIAGTTWDPSDDALFTYDNKMNYRRRMLAKTIYLRNMGLF